MYILMRGYGNYLHMSGKTLMSGSGGSVLLDKGAGGSQETPKNPFIVI
jgi:hypothetical protein